MIPKETIKNERRYKMKNDVKQITIGIESLAPFDAFGDMLGKGPFAGDGDERTFNPNDNKPTDTARIRYHADIDIEENRLEKYDAKSTGTENLATGAKETAKIPRETHYNHTSKTLTFSYSGGNPLVMGAPDIDIKGELKFSEEEEGLHIAGSLYGDGFPATEAYVHFNGQDKGVMLGSSPIKAGTDKDYGPTQLIDGGVLAQEKIMDIDVAVSFKDQRPEYVTNMHTGHRYTVEQWNERHATKPMVREYDHACPTLDQEDRTLPEECDYNDNGMPVQIDKETDVSSNYTIVKNGIILHADYNTTKAEDIQRAPSSTVKSIDAGKAFVEDLNLSTDNSNDQGYGIGD